MGSRTPRLCCCCLVATALVLTACGPRAERADRRPSDLEAYVAGHAANGDFSGIVLVTRQGKTLFEKAAGLASRSFDVPIRSDTRFLVASVTKTFTAAGIEMLRQQGKLKIEDGLDAYVPDFPHAGKIQLLHLLLHQSGLSDPDYGAIVARNVTPDELVRMIGAKPLLFAPGSDSRYSNAGYVTLARVIERVDGRSFDRFLRESVFDRLGMADSGTLRSGEVVPRLAEGYVPGVGEAFLRAGPFDPSSLFGSGNVYGTARDLDRWLTAIDRHELFDIDKQPYPFGWGRRDWFEKNVLVQSGIVDGYSSIILTVPAEELHLVVVMNTQSGFTGDEGKTLLGIVLGTPAPVPARRGAPPVLPRATLDRWAGEYLWGAPRYPMHLTSDGSVLTLRWGDSPSAVTLTPIGEAEFFDRTSFSRIRFRDNGLVWVQNGEETAANRVPS